MRHQLIEKLTNAMNANYKTQLTEHQVDFWVGDHDHELIKGFIAEVESSDESALTPEDILSLWEEQGT